MFVTLARGCQTACHQMSEERQLFATFFTGKLTQTLAPTHNLSLSLSHTHTHTHTPAHVHKHIIITLSLYLSHIPKYIYIHIYLSHILYLYTSIHTYTRTHTHKQTLRQIDNNVYMYIHIDIQYLPRIGNAVGEKCALCYKEQNNLTHTSTLSPSTTYVVTAHHLAAVALSHCHIVTFSLRSVPTQSH